MTRTAWNDPARPVLAAARYAGMRWDVEDSGLYLSGTTEALTEAHRAAIDRHRPRLVRILETLPARCVVPHMCCVLGPCDPARCRQEEPQQEGEPRNACLSAKKPRAEDASIGQTMVVEPDSVCWPA